MIKFLSRLAVVGLIGGIATGPAALGQTAPPAAPVAVTVLELFTSQGCSSCPAADALFKSYVERPDVLALSYSVDYWDYLGWKDTLASPKFTERQRAYGKSVSNGQIYTPQMVINGVRHAVGSSRGDIEAAVAATRASPAAQAFRIEASRADGAIAVRSAGSIGSASAAAPGVVWLVTVRGEQAIAVTRGENSGRTLSYANVVRDVAQVGEWTGQPLTVRVPAGSPALGPDERYAVLIQRGQQGPLLGAGWVQ
jgi:hypothetical protein